MNCGPFGAHHWDSSPPALLGVPANEVAEKERAKQGPGPGETYLFISGVKADVALNAQNMGPKCTRNQALHWVQTRKPGVPDKDPAVGSLYTCYWNSLWEGNEFFYMTSRNVPKSGGMQASFCER